MRLSRQALWLPAIFGLALLFRILYFIDYSDLLEFSQPTVDALFHHLSAQAIAGGALSSAEPFFRAPLYNYFLAIIYFLSGNSIAVARLAQLLLGALVPVLTFLLARRLFDFRIAVIAALLILFCGDLVYFQGELLLDGLVTLELLALFLLYFRLRPGSSRHWLYLAGLLAGLTVITRPNAIVAAVVLLYLLIRETDDGRQALLGRSLRFLAGFLLPLLIVLGHNLTREEPAFTLATQGGINFYLGNNRAADGVSAVMPGKLGYDWQYADVKYLAETESGHKLTHSEVSSYYYRKGWSEIAAAPVHWLGLLIKKTYLIYSKADISNNRNLISFKAKSAVLDFLPIGMGLLGPLGLVGLGWSCRNSVRHRAVTGLVILYSLTFVLFFVNSRFRLPLLPWLAIFAAHAVIAGWDRLRQGKLRSLIIPTVVALLLLLILNLNLYQLQFDNRQQAEFGEGNLLMQAGNNQAALAHFLSALESEQPLPRAALNVGVAWLRLGQTDSARKYFLLEDSLTAGSAEALNNLAYLARRNGNQAKAVEYSRRALSLKPYLTEARLNLWHSMRETGMADSVYIGIVEYQKDHRLSAQEKFLMAVAALDLGLPRVTISTLKEILADSLDSSRPSYAELSSGPRLFGSLPDAGFRSKIHYNLGTAFGADRNLDSAIVYLRSALALDPGLSEAWINLGTALLTAREFTQAVDAMEQAVQLGTRSEVLHYNLALAELALADSAAARRNLDICLEYNPEFSRAQQLLDQLK